MSWLLSTLSWTGALIALVLLVRRPVARQFGARVAYALWLLPLLRLIVPPIVLPAWMAPVRDAAPGQGHETVLVIAEATAGESVITAPPAFDWQSALLFVWLAGAAIYIVSRLASYARLREELLTDARPVGEVGRIRLLETPATASPLAFGVFDQVVALPPGFMAASDRRARDLALAHELAHHRAHDLAVNFLALPLFALHWFNPLARLGWQAMRRDQEAACDARVIERCDRAERVAYAALIAHAVAGPRGALAAPMACPVLGDKSILHRLRTIAMTDLSRRRRRTGLALVGAAALLVPLTASFSYAQDAIEEVPLPPSAPDAPAAPLPPAAPVAPLAPEVPDQVIVDVDAPAATTAPTVRRYVIVRDKDGKHAPLALRDGETRVIETRRDGHAHDAELAKQLEAMGVELGKLDEQLAGRAIFVDRKMAELAPRLKEIEARTARALAVAPIVTEDCSKGSAKETVTPEGNRVIRLCHRNLIGPGVLSLRMARSQIAGQPGMDEGTKRDVLRSLDREIERLESAK